MNTPNKHHYVPQFLLRNFAEGRKNKARIWTFDKSTAKAFRGSVRDAGHENKFYDADDINGFRIQAEPLLGKLDTAGARSLLPIVSGAPLPFTPAFFDDISFFVAVQMLRVPSKRNESEFIRTSLIEKFGPDIRVQGDDRPLREYSAADSNFLSIAALGDTPRYAEILRQKVWFLLKAPAGSAFTLSDNPVVKNNALDYGLRGSLGIAQEGIEIYMPISPSLCLQFLCPEIAHKMDANIQDRQTQRAGLPFTLEPEDVDFVNSLQVFHSERFVYALDSKHLNLARQMLAQNPGLSIPTSRKIVAN